MKVALDVTPLLIGSTGVARYVAELVAALDPAELTTWSVGRVDPGSNRPAPVGTKHLPVPLRVVHRAWETVHLPRLEMLVRGADLVHSTDMVAPPSRLPRVLTIHDVAAVDLPALHPARGTQTALRQLASARTVDAVCCPSAAVKADLVRLGLREERVHVTPLGATELPSPRTPRPAHLPAPGYALHVGAITARKDVGFLLDVWAAAPGLPLLVLAGPPGYLAEQVTSRIPGMGGRVVHLTGMTDADVADLYDGASVVVSSTRAEGFGLPFVEALAAGRPLVVSDLPVAREVTGGHATFIPLGDVAAWCDALTGTLAPPVAATLPTWAACAAKTRAVYEGALA